MADETVQDATPTVDVKTRANLAYIWSVALIVLIAYTLYEYGGKEEILTLIIGFLTGTAATVLAVYFGAPIAAKKPDPTVTQTGENPVTNVTRPPAPPTT